MKAVLFLGLLGLFLFSREINASGDFHKGILTCSDCHTAYPGDVTKNAEANVNLCLNCHMGGAVASNLALYSVDQATITATGLLGFSHRWDVSPYKVDIATLPTGTGITTTPWGTPLASPIWKWTGDAKALKDNNGQWRLACSSCHNSKTLSYYRDPEQRDKKICLNCHRIMKHMDANINDPEKWGNWESIRVYTGKKMNHPVGRYGSAWIGCSTCHPVHGTK